MDLTVNKSGIERRFIVSSIPLDTLNERRKIIDERELDMECSSLYDMVDKSYNFQ